MTRTCLLRAARHLLLGLLASALLLIGSPRFDGTALSQGGRVTVLDMPAGSFPCDLEAGSTCHRAYVTEVNTKRVRVIDIDTRATVALVDMTEEPGDPTLSPDETRLYVGLGDTPYLGALDTATNQFLGWLDIGYAGTVGALTADGTSAFLLRWDRPGVALLEVPTGVIQVEIQYWPDDANLRLCPDGSVELPRAPRAAFLSPDESTLYVACENGPDDYSTYLYAVEMSSLGLLAVITTQGNGGANAAFSADGSKLYVVRPNCDQLMIQVIDVASQALDPNYPNGIPLPDGPTCVWVDSTGTRAYVTVGSKPDMRLAIIDLTTSSLVTQIDLPDGWEVTDGAYIADKEELWLVQLAPMVEQPDESWHRTGDGRIVIVDVSGL